MRYGVNLWLLFGGLVRICSDFRQSHWHSSRRFPEMVLVALVHESARLYPNHSILQKNTKKKARRSLKELFTTRTADFQTATLPLFGKEEKVQFLCLNLLWGKGLYQELRFVLLVHEVRCSKRTGNMVTHGYVPDRGDLVWLFNPQAGHDQSGKRPALVVSPASYNGKAGLSLLCPVILKQKGYPFEVVIPQALPIEGVILADQVKSLDWQSRQAAFICKIPLKVLSEVIAKLDLLIR